VLSDLDSIVISAVMKASAFDRNSLRLIKDTSADPVYPDFR
jgi:hypothetical protein